MMQAKVHTLRSRLGEHLRHGTALPITACEQEPARLREAMRRTEMLCGVTDEQADSLLQLMRGRLMKAGATLFREGARGDSLVLVACGAVEIQKLHKGSHGMRTLAVLRQPAVLGTDVFKGTERRTVTVKFRTEGMAFFLRMGAFAQWVARQVPWCEVEKIPAAEADILWIGSGRTRPRGAAGMRCLQLHRLRAYVREVPTGRSPYCLARDDHDSAVAAFLLAQRGLAAVAVRNGRKFVETGRQEGSEA